MTLDPVARMWNGCSTAFWVRLLDEDDVIFVTLDFFDLEGGEMFFVGDWVSPEGRWFDLGWIIDLGGGYCGRLEITTHEDVDVPWAPLYKPVRVEVIIACECP